MIKKTSFNTVIGNLTVVSKNSKLIAIENTGDENSVEDKFNSYIISQIMDYFNGNLKEFDYTCIELDKSNDFKYRVLIELMRIPFGEITSYKKLAEKVGSPQGARAVGNAVGSNPIPIIIPCHRVLKYDGGLGGFSWGLDTKKTLLKIEKIIK